MKKGCIIDKDFHLSKRTKEFPPIPHFTEVYVDNSEKLNLIAFLGFERKRLGQIFSYEDNIKYNNFIAVLPLPAFNVGWENRTLNSHITFFNNSYNFDELRYVSANNPYQVNTLLTKLLKTKKYLTIAPLGTKPNAIGCAIFLVNCKQDNSMPTRLIYDFPTRVPKRSNGIGKIQVYNLSNIL